MKKCPKYKTIVDEEFDCLQCIFHKAKKCQYNKWIPGLKSERDLDETEEIGNA